ncbi:hypothetical protein ACQJBY_056192 [Aegilops geniculata]
MDPPPLVHTALEYSLQKYLLLLATMVITVTYAAGFNPPGGVWQVTHEGKLAGDPIILETHYRRYLTFYYCNATAFGASLVVIVSIVIFTVRHNKKKRGEMDPSQPVMLLRFFMVLVVLSLMGAYGTGTCRDKSSTVYFAALVAAVILYIPAVKLMDCRDKNSDSDAGTIQAHILISDPAVRGEQERLRHREALEKLKAQERLRKLLMLLATFAVSITYSAGLNTPGGFWDSTAGGHHPGDVILKDHHNVRLTVFLLCNTTAFVASLLIIMLLIVNSKKLHALSLVLYACIVVTLVGLIGAYVAGSCRKTSTTAQVVGLAGGAVALAYILLRYTLPAKSSSCCSSGETRSFATHHSAGEEAMDKAHPLVVLLATLAATITYTAGLDPPGGLWQDDGDGHMAGDPILLTTNVGRYRAFFYCNSVAFVTSLVVIVLVQMGNLVRHHMLLTAMILNLFGLIGAYAAGSCRDVSTSIYAMALTGAVLIYVVIHIVFFTLDHKDKKDNYQEEQLLEKRRKRLLLFAVLAATITYQAGLTPPGGFLLQDKLGHHAGDPVLLYNYPRRYNAFFYSNSVSFMLSITLIILLVNPNLYRPAIRSNALSVCMVVGLFCSMGAYAAGSTQHLKISIYVFLLVAVVLYSVLALLLVFLLRKNGTLEGDQEQGKKVKEKKWDWDQGERKKHARRKNLMLLGILVASVAYQAGLKPPGGAWQSNDNGHEAGNPVMHDKRGPRYLAFFYSNSISFMASIAVIILLLPHWLPNKKEEEWEKRSLRVMNWTIRLGLVALLVAYAAGSNRGWKTSVYVIALNIAVLGYFAIHIILCICERSQLKGRFAATRHKASLQRSNSM